MYKKIKVIVIFSFITIGFILIILGFYFKEKQQNKKEDTFISKTDYDITLKDNPFFASKTLPSNHYYVAKLIDQVNITFDLTLNESYDYIITTTLKGYVNNDEIWQKDYPSLSGFFDRELKKKVSIDYETYVNLFKDFQNTYNLSLDGKVIVALKVISKDRKIYPLVEVEISIDDKIAFVVVNKLDNTFTEKGDNIYKILVIVGLSIIIIFLLIVFKKYPYPKDNFSSVLKRYADLIIKMPREPDIHNLNIIYLNSINDLISFAISYNAKILVYDNTFYIYNQQNCYIYKNFLE